MRKFFILIDHFYPAYKAGGPIQSITNLILSLQDNYSINVLTSAYDLRSDTIMHGVKINDWNIISLPQSTAPIRVWYADKKQPTYEALKKIFKEELPDIVYLNGIFSYRLFILPLFVLKKLAANYKIIICPRGMLQKGALANKSLKKKTYLNFLRFSGVVNKVVWHATNTEEKEDILKHFGENNEIVIAMNIPKKPFEKVSGIEKTQGDLKLVYLSLITEKKNLLFLLELLKQTTDISLDIYGPVKDHKYWNQCMQLINQIPGKVKYLASITPSQVQGTFAEYHASILLTKGENFGHALYESLSVGRPIITSNFTPWNDLEECKAGWNFDISDPVKCINKLNAIKQLNQEEYSQFSTGAYNMAKDYFTKSGDLNNYKKLFSATAQ